MPHFFITMGVSSPNPGRWTRAQVEEVCGQHHGKLENFWHDDRANPTTAYLLVENGDLDALSEELHARHIVTLHRAP
jgi:hypothetical protein